MTYPADIMTGFRTRRPGVRALERGGLLAIALIVCAAVGCTDSTATPTTTTQPAAEAADPTDTTKPGAPTGAQPRLATDPAQIADDLVADELAIRDPSTPEPELVAAARRQQ